MKRILLGSVALALTASLALAQVNYTPQSGITSGYLGKATYSAGFLALPPAASATDILCIAGSASKTVRLTSIRISGTAGTLVTVPLALARRVSVDTGGTAATTTANPANNVAARDTSSPVSGATATVIGYSANPTITDSSPTWIDGGTLTLPVTSAGTSSSMLNFDYSKDNENNVTPPTLRGVAQQICVNVVGAVSISSGVLYGSINWTEE